MANAQPLLQVVSPGGDQKRPPLFPIVRFLTSCFAIITACYFIAVAATILYGDPSCCATAPSTSQAASSSTSSAASVHVHPASSSSPPPLVPKCYELVGAYPFVRGLMWGSPPQAALALLLAGGGRRTSRLGMALAFVTLAATVANHVLFASLVVIICAATSADTIGTVAAVVFGFYLFAAAVVLLGLLGVLAFLLCGGERDRPFRSVIDHYCCETYRHMGAPLISLRS